MANFGLVSNTALSITSMLRCSAGTRTSSKRPLKLLRNELSELVKATGATFGLSKCNVQMTKSEMEEAKEQRTNKRL